MFVFGLFSIVGVTRQLTQTQTNLSASASTSTSNITELERVTGGDLIFGNNTSADNAKLTVSKVSEGAFIVKASGFTCAPYTTNCNQERYEFRLPFITGKPAPQVFGAGMHVITNQAALADFTDENFSYSHCVDTKITASGRERNEKWASSCRMRTPIFVIPEQKLLIAYLQPYSKVVRLSRTNEFSCGDRNTCIVMKLGDGQTNFATQKELIIIKKPTLDEVYQAYKQIKTELGYYDKEPTYMAFGPGWETFGDLGCAANRTDAMARVNWYLDQKIVLTTATIGSGYWASDKLPGCGPQDVGGPAQYPIRTTDSLLVNQDRWGGISGLSQWYSFLTSTSNHPNKALTGRGTVPLIGMRQRVTQYESLDNAANDSQNLKHKNLILSKFSQVGISNPLIDANRMYMGPNRNDPGDDHYLLSPTAQVINRWIDLIRSGDGASLTGYGNFGGVKFDDMTAHDQAKVVSFMGPNRVPTVAPAGVPQNLGDNYGPLFMPHYTNRLGNQFVILARNSWIANPADVVVPDYIHEDIRGHFDQRLTYILKYQLDSAITEVMSGYPVVQNVTFYNDVYNEGVLNPDGTRNTNRTINNNVFLRSNQLAVFQGATIFSVPFDKTSNTTVKNALIFYGKLRNRLHQYAYDQAMRSYETGSMYVTRPLFFDYPNDPEVYKLYDFYNPDLSVTNAVKKDPRNEFMFGNALLVRPIFEDATANDSYVYFPAGTWKSLLKVESQIVSPGGAGGKILYNHSSANLINYPVFMKEKEILIMADENDYKKMWAHIYISPATFAAANSASTANKPKSSIYYYHVDNPANGRVSRTYELQVTVNSTGNVTLKNNTTGATRQMRNDSAINYGKDTYMVEINDLLQGAITPTPLPLPNNLTVSSVSPGNQTISWNLPSGAVGSGVRVDDTSNPWNGSCIPNPGDACSTISGSSHVHNFVAGRTYNIWVHAVYASGWSGSVSRVVTVPGTIVPTNTPTPTRPPPTPTPLLAPTNLTVSAQNAGKQTISWTLPAGATESGLRINDESDPWNCINSSEGDICSTISASSFSYHFQPGRTYNIWVHAVYSGAWSSAPSYRFTVPHKKVIQTAVVAGGTEILTRYQGDDNSWTPWTSRNVTEMSINVPVKSLNYVVKSQQSDKALKQSFLYAGDGRVYYREAPWAGSYYGQYNAWASSALDLPAVGRTQYGFDEEVLTNSGTPLIKQSVLYAKPSTGDQVFYARTAPWNGSGYTPLSGWSTTYATITGLPNGDSATSIDYYQETSDLIHQYALSSNGQNVYKRTLTVSTNSWSAWSTISMSSLIPTSVKPAGTVYIDFDVSNLP